MKTAQCWCEGATPGLSKATVGVEARELGPRGRAPRRLTDVVSKAPPSADGV